MIDGVGRTNRDTREIAIVSMLKPILCSIALLVIASSANAQSAAAGVDFGSIIPRDWKIVPVPVPRGSTERKFTSPRGDAWLALRAGPARGSVASQLARFETICGGEITYERQGRTWIVVSGFKGDRIFYGKAMLACGGRGWHILEFEYPAAEKRAFDGFVTRSSRALGAYARSGCQHIESSEGGSDGSPNARPPNPTLGPSRDERARRRTW